MGQILSRGITSLGLDEREVGVLLEGLRDAALDAEPKVDVREYAQKVQAFTMARRKQLAEAEKEASSAFVLQEAAAPGAEQLESGLVFRSVSEGEGESPKATDRVKVNYEGKLRDGTVFDSSIERGEPAVFPLNRVIPCWTEALQRMKPGGKAYIVCPSDIAYGDRGSPPRIKPGAALAFDVELIEVVKGEPPLPPGHPPTGQHPAAPHPAAPHPTN
jgi:FKBP-type peptidyl-prolyl cis-trans isomerase FkpA